MKKSIVLLASFCLALVLSACGSVEQYELDGTWDYTSTLTQSDFEDAEIGATFNGELVVVATETTVTFTDENDLTGESSLVTARDGNRVIYSDGAADELGSFEIVFEGTFTSATSFSGTLTESETFDGETASETQEIVMTKQ